MTQASRLGSGQSPAIRPVRRSGQIQTYGDDRTCEADRCDTKLSRYNKEPMCFKHFEQLRNGQSTGRVSRTAAPPPGASPVSIVPFN